MKKLKSLGLICFSLLLILSSCSSALFENISKPNNNVLVDAKDAFKFESIIKRVKESVVLLAMSPNANPDIDASQNAMCSGVVVDEIGHVLTNFHCVYNHVFNCFYY